MKKISSNATFIYKVIIPLLWLVIAMIALIALVIEILKSNIPSFPNLIMQFIFFPVTFWFVWYYGFRVVSEVYDMGDGLIIKNKPKNFKILDTNIKDISFSPTSNPSLVTIYLKMPNEIGDKFTFISTQNTGFLMNRNADIEQLMQRLNLRK